jgi:hypothetical protein
VLNYARPARRATERGQKAKLDWIRLRLKGGLDLYRLAAETHRERRHDR